MIKITMAALLFSITLVTSSTYAGPSSDIPDRREFPVNPLVDPCQDFYQYTCSKVNESFKLREDRSSHTFSFADSSERLLLKRKAYFQKLSTAELSSDREIALKNVYSSCMNLKARKVAERNEVSRVKEVMLGKISSREDFLKLISASYLAAESSPLEWGPIANQDNAENNDLYVSTEYLSLPEKSYYKKPEVIKDFESLLVLFFKEVKAKDPIAQAKVIIDFEKGLAEVTPEPDQFRQIINNRNPITRDELTKKFPHLGLESLLKEIPGSVVIRNWVPEAMAYTDNFLATAPLESLKSIYLYNSLKGYMDDSYPKFFDAQFKFKGKHFGGPNKRPDRAERCTRQVSQVFAKELDAILMAQIFPNFPREKFVALAEKIRASILESLNENQWLSKDAKVEAIQKMKSARLQLVAPETDKEWDFLPAAKYSATDSIENSKIISKVYQKKSLLELHEPTDKGRWDMGPLTVNAYYDPSFNKFVMPIGILQYPFYDPNLSEVQNAGAVGAVIGHELGHGIDDQGARYDSKGKQRQWMSMKDLKNFSDRTTPLIAQFDSIGHNGKLTQGENIGDLVGLSAAYRLASKSKEFQADPQLQKELFLSYGRAWCTVARPKYEETQLKTNPHSLGRARVNEQVKHQAGFAKAFQCKESDPMVLPKEKQVRIW